MHRLMSNSGVVWALVLTCSVGMARGVEAQNQSQVVLPGSVFSANARWNVQSGTFTMAGDKSLGQQVLTTRQNNVVLESRAPQIGNYEVRALVRLRAGGQRLA